MGIGEIYNIIYLIYVDAWRVFLYTWDNRKEENDFTSNTIYTIINFRGGLSMTKDISKNFYYDDNIIVHWNGDKIFNVLRDEVLIDSFEEHETLTPAKAELIADDYLADALQEEMLDHADIYHDEESEEQYA